MKRLFLSLSGMLAIIVFFSACYYISFLNTVRQLENDKRLQENVNVLPELLAEGSEEISPAVSEKNDESVVLVEASAEDAIITADTVCIYQLYYLDSGEQVQYEMKPGADIAGLTRGQLNNKLRRYMEQMTVMEYEAGLLSYELVSFSPERVVFQKVYDRDRVQFKYYVSIKNEAVVVFYSDKKTVFEYTGILQNELDDEIRTALSIGIPVRDVEELYDFLSGITS